MTAPWNGRGVDIPGVATVSYLDAAAPRRPPRTPNCYTTDRAAPGEYAPSKVQPVTILAWHTVHGHANGQIMDGAQCATTSVWSYADTFADPSREGSSHFLLGPRVALVIADLWTDRTWTTGNWNPFAIGIEMDELSSGAQCAGVVAQAVDLAWWLTLRFGLQPMVPWRNGAPDLSDIDRLQSEDGARTWRGSAFHGNKNERGPGDPGPAFARAFVASGAEGFDARSSEDRAVWRERQAWLGIPRDAQDGIPGPQTVAALRARTGRTTWATRKGAGGSWGLAAAAVAVGVAAASWRRRARR